MNDKKLEKIKFHIEDNDYFGTLAMVLGLIKNQLEKKNNFIEIIKTLDDCVSELTHLQKNYKITDKCICQFDEVLKIFPFAFIRHNHSCPLYDKTFIKTKL